MVQIWGHHGTEVLAKMLGGRTGLWYRSGTIMGQRFWARGSEHGLFALSSVVLSVDAHLSALWLLQEASYGFCRGGVMECRLRLALRAQQHFDWVVFVALGLGGGSGARSMLLWLVPLLPWAIGLLGSRLIPGQAFLPKADVHPGGLRCCLVFQRDWSAGNGLGSGSCLAILNAG